MDDDFFILGGLRKVLRGYFDVHTASDGATAKAIVERLHPDIVLVDMLLAYENGLDILEGLRQLLPGAQLVGMSSFPGREIIHEAFACGADAFLAKEEMGLVHELLDRLVGGLQNADR